METTIMISRADGGCNEGSPADGRRSCELVATRVLWPGNLVKGKKKLSKTSDRRLAMAMG
jgi:hypothetical protein